MTVPAVNQPARTWRGELIAMFVLAWPLVVAQLAQNALFTTDVIMMGWLGPEYLAAGTLATAFFTPFLLLGGGIASAVAPLAAQALGGRKIRNVRRTVRQGFWACIIVTAVLTPLIWQIGPIYRALGQQPELVELAEIYMHIAVLVLLPALGQFALRSFLSAVGSTQVILLVTLAGVLLNAALNYALMFGNFGFPRLELRGAAITTVIANLFMFMGLLVYTLTHRRHKRFHILVRFWKPDWPRLIEIFRIGTPIGLTIMAEVGLFSVATVFIGWLGTDAVAAHAVALQCASLAFMVPLGIGMAATVRVGIAYGAGDDDAVSKAGWTSLIVGTGFMAVTALLFITMPGIFVRLFLDPNDPGNAAALTLAAVYLAMAGIFQIVDGAQVVAAHALRGLSDTRVPMYIAFVSYWAIGMPIAYVAGFVLGLEGIGVWLGLAAGLAVAAVVLSLRFAMRERLGLMIRHQIVAVPSR
ncbi:MATE family efflux transporter [Pelagibacterium montanilacus]|uniref:MATE family efflux transporter n=1 Tax=Pelagibacterium montanilacus TaxID=2185280 RepID=UPI0013E0E5A0|nr:MATE family efflux transporter [Pelagibacterium montanilacus]